MATAKSITVRLGRPADAQELARMSRDLIEHGLGWTWTPGRVLREICNRETVTAVACEGQRVVAFAIMYFGDEDAHLNLLAVKPEFQGKGVGRRLMDWLRTSCLTAGIKNVQLELRSTNHAARLFYRRVGFREVGQVPFYYAEREAAVKMSLGLGVRPTETKDGDSSRH